MMRTDGFQQPGTTVVVVQQPRFGAFMPTRRGVKLGSFMAFIHLTICLGLFGAVITLTGTMFIALSGGSKEFWEHFDRKNDPTDIVGYVLLAIGLLLLSACVISGCFAGKKYKQYKEERRNNPEGVINHPPLPGSHPEQHPFIPGQSSGVAPYEMNPGTHRPPYSQGYSGGGGQPSYYPPPATAPAGFNPSVPTSETKSYPPPAGTTMPDVSNQYTATNYDVPPPYAPDYKHC